ncbi:urease accessory protein UreF [Rhodobacteraceae bacterium M385]|nr:urease accessory protein UreF [Rhodobacteraceae bacterium M385]
MPIEGDILALAQWLSPSFPVGAFAYSHGLETAIHDGTIATSEGLQTWLEDVLRHGTGRNDCILLRAAHAAPTPDDLAQIGATARAFCGSAERVMETTLQGTAFSTTAAAIWGGDAADFPYPVAVGAASAALNIDVTTTAAMYLHAFTSNLVSVAVRAVPLGQTEGQAVLAALTPLCLAIVEETETATLDDLQSTAFLSDIAAMRHEALQPRIFRS